MFKNILHSILSKTGYQVVHREVLATLQTHKDYNGMLEDIRGEYDFLSIYSKCKPYTMTSIERMYALYSATRYLIDAGVKGSFVECGVYKGGSMMMCAYTLNRMGVTDRDIYLYDTYRGMPEPSHHDTDFVDQHAQEIWMKSQNSDFNDWCFSSLDECRSNILATSYPEERFKFIEGKVEDTIPLTIPSEIALLRLDTDWFHSTLYELKHLFPLLSKNGVLIIDDYGHWKGARKAADKYFSEENIALLLCRIDYTGRMAIKL